MEKLNQCEAKSCSNQSESLFCEEFNCKKISESELCDNRCKKDFLKCGVQDCSNESLCVFCIEHQCEYPYCTDVKEFGESICKFHKSLRNCEVIGCTNLFTKPFCFAHKCTEANCNNIREVGKRKCKIHHLSQLETDIEHKLGRCFNIPVNYEPVELVDPITLASPPAATNNTAYIKPVNPITLNRLPVERID